MTEPGPVKKIAHLLRNGVFPVERELRGRVERNLDRVESILSVDQVSDVFHALESNYDEAAVPRG